MKKSMGKWGVLGKWAFGLFVIMIISVFVLSGYFTSDQQGSRGALNKPLGSFNGQDVPLEMLVRQVNAQRAQYGEILEKNPMLEQILFSERNLLDMASRLVDQMARLEMVEKQLGLKVAPEEVRRAIASTEFFQTNGQFDRKKYRDLLAANGISPAKYEDDVHQSLLERQGFDFFQRASVATPHELKVWQGIRAQKRDLKYALVSREAARAQVTVTPAQIQEFLVSQADAVRKNYDDRAAEFNPGSQVKARHILLKEKTAENKEKLESLRKSATPKNFADLAKKNSQEPGADQSGGDLGWFGKGVMDPAFEAAALGLKKGQISELVESSFGYHLILVEDTQEGVGRSFDSVKNQIAAELIRQQADPTSALATLVAQVQQELAGAKVGSKIGTIEIKEAKEINRERPAIAEVAGWEGAFQLPLNKASVADVRGDQLVVMVAKEYTSDTQVTSTEKARENAGRLYTGFTDEVLANGKKKVNEALVRTLVQAP